MSKQPPNQTGNRLTRAEAKAAARSGSPDTPASGRRRSLLKAAASAAPVIATLPSGEALANASALQCVINVQQDNNPPEALVSPTLPDEDTWARVVGEIQTWTINNPDSSEGAPDEIAVQVYHIPRSGDATNIYVYGQNSAVGVPPAGSQFDTDAAVTGPAADPSPAFFLYQYDASNAPIEDATDVAVAPGGTLPTGCNFETGLENWSTSSVPPSADYCFYPMAVQTSPNSNGNIPLTHSCLTSFK